MKGHDMAKQQMTVIVCDLCGTVVKEDTAQQVNIKVTHDFSDALEVKKGGIEDACLKCYGVLQTKLNALFTAPKPRGRKPVKKD